MQKVLISKHIEPLNLSPFQRILLTTDGTLTEILEAYLLEKIQLVKLSEEIVKITKSIPALDLDIGNQVIERKVLLQGKISLNNFIYAESIIVHERLDNRLRTKLTESQEPIGRLWLEHKVETFKEIIDSAIETSDDLSDYFNIAREDKILSRTYRVFSNKKPIIMITEKFPESYFLKKF
ncbi:chorismate--pyruvate lyase family protein [Nostoc sp. 'Peltigera membranacea cyanobiont' 232]|uniref:chorismate--pyruvate lyase family protein n=1 Tax=Nostoc sp. 'Peltigera membranacea cyanobiont' 232 TaxID=2014531 RepID=UPI000B9512D0|nr:chorismate pyruvate-lyase family protein [Nostoc sp. 'Peltigera membranacea cyanobiont' 232]OYE06094.1 4-hydroxybenzoate synthetase [Nostoc sp. 'Peltigera membranacea cyanobiont' 232]